MELKNKNVFVTGSTRGIGLAVAHQFASLGANVVLNGRSEISEDLLAQFVDYGVTVVGISGDISNGEDAKPVSYTHLDVYKRQVLVVFFLTGSPMMVVHLTMMTGQLSLRRVIMV